ncbi:type VII secretion protein EssB [Streptococcus sp. DD12]|uniref:type VII secretion protein EssB n=1 Tax=Streptococcus sp. DD12 TaxID=1777880 RepID=UPI00079A3305|nr:type VII secretion protein EssB [Streptococcus sp. DD12]KXT75907.1 putative secretion system component EssB/YukC [Streptococcus sp. DD12]
MTSKRQESLMLGDAQLTYDKTPHIWHLRLSRSFVSAPLDSLRLLTKPYPGFLEVSLTEDADDVILKAQLPEKGYDFDQVKAMAPSDKLRFALNTLHLSSALRLSISFFMAPENIFITRNLEPLLAYRGLPGSMPTEALTPEDFKRQLTCLIVALFSEHAYADLYQGGLESKQLAPLLDQIGQAESLKVIQDLLEEAYEEAKAKEESTLVLVPKRRFRFYRLLSCWGLGLALLVLLPLGYLLFIRGPHQTLLLSADSRYVAQDYSGVINQLEHVSLKTLPSTQKYELAYSYIQSLDLTDKQREVVLSALSLKSDERYLDYWIQIGRGQGQEAIDLAKQLDDSDLVLYAISQRMATVRNDTTLSGAERENTLSSLQKDYDDYWKNRSSALSEDSSSSISKETP